MLARKKSVQDQMLKAMGLKSMKDVPADQMKEFKSAVTANMKKGVGRKKAPEMVTNRDGSKSQRSVVEKSMGDAYDKHDRKKAFDRSATGQTLELSKQEKALEAKKKAIADLAEEEKLRNMSIKDRNALTRKKSLESQRKGAGTRLKKDFTNAKNYITDTAKSSGKAIDRRAQDVGQLLGGTVGKGGKVSRRLRGYGALGAGAAALGGAAYGASQMGKEASTLELFEYAAMDRAKEMLDFGKEAGFSGDHVDTYALEILQDAGYDVSPMIRPEVPYFDYEDDYEDDSEY
jgi:hypothetical protein